MLGPIGSTIYIQEDPILLSNLKRSNIVMDLDNSETDQKMFVCGSLGYLCLVSAWWCWWCWWCSRTPLFIYLSEKLSPIFSSWKNPFLFPVHLFPREDLFCIIFYLWSHLSQIDKGTNLIVFQIRKISRERSPKKNLQWRNLHNHLSLHRRRFPKQARLYFHHSEKWSGNWSWI